MPPPTVKVHFWPHSRRMHVASYRLRCHLVMEGLRAQGVDAALYEAGDRPSVLVLSKLYDPASLAQALELKRQFGTRLYLDLCDNHFYFKEASAEASRRTAELDVAVRAVDHVIASTAYLADVIQQRPQMSVPVSVIEDLVEFPRPRQLLDPLRHPRRYLQYLSLKSWLEKTTPDVRRRLVWFGNHGGGFADSGMYDLRTIRPTLDELYRQVPISLTVISNSREKYEALVHDWTVPTYYLEWNETFISPALRLHGVSVIPITRNPFTLAKSPNRVETSLIHGLGVVADRIPSYDKYRDDIYLDDWQEGLQALVGGTGDRGRLRSAEFAQANRDVIRAWQGLLCDAPEGFDESAVAADAPS